MNAMIPMYVHTTNFISDRVAAIKDNYADRERGANLVEYAGLIVLAAVILALVYAGITQAHLQNTLTHVVNNILKGTGGTK